MRVDIVEMVPGRWRVTVSEGDMHYVTTNSKCVAGNPFTGELFEQIKKEALEYFESQKSKEE